MELHDTENAVVALANRNAADMLRAYLEEADGYTIFTNPTDLLEDVWLYGNHVDEFANKLVSVNVLAALCTRVN